MDIYKRLTKDPANFSTEEIAETLNMQYAHNAKMVQGFIEKNLPKRGLIVNGPAGGGKTETVCSIINRAGVDAVMISGTITAPQLFIDLYQCRKPGQVLVIDDTDAVLEDTGMADILKGAIDTGKPKEISYNKRSVNLRMADCPNSFVFAGKVIIITNTHINNRNFTKKQDQLLRPVFDRCNYVYAGLSKLWTAHAIQKHFEEGTIRCFNESDIPADVQKDMVDFILELAEDIEMLSFRSLITCIGAYQIDADDWKSVAYPQLVGVNV